MYIVGVVIPVPEARRADYAAWARMSAALLMEYGCQSVTEAIEDFVPIGQQTDFRRAVASRPGEKIVFAWQIWPDKETLGRAEAAMSQDPRFVPPDDLPFDQKRLIMGCFTPLLTDAAGIAEQLAT